MWDGLRGIAILIVLAYHTWLFSWYTPQLTLLGVAIPVAVPVRTGYLGVEIFFVISGFVLFFPYALGKTQPIGEFARRRALKIVPSYAIALVVTAFSALTLVPKPDSVLAAFANHVTFVQNFYNDQFGTANSVFWSLAIEVQFYAVFPLVAWVFRRRPLLTALAMIAIAIAYRSEAARCCLQIEPVTRQLPAFLDLFALGMLAAFVTVRLRASTTTPHRVTSIAWSAGVCVAIAAGWLLIAGADEQTYVPGGKEHFVATHRTLLGIVVAAFGVCSSFAPVWWRRVLANPLLVFLSIVSYNLYLWHTLVLIWMWKHGVPQALTADPHDDPHWKLVYIPLGWFFCIAIATTITYFIERPLLSSVRRHPFSFDWRSVRLRPIAPSGKRT